MWEFHSQNVGDCFICVCERFHVFLFLEFLFSRAILIFIEIKHRLYFWWKLDSSKLTHRKTNNSIIIISINTTVFVLNTVTHSFSHGEIADGLFYLYGWVWKFFHNIFNEVFVHIKLLFFHTAGSIKEKHQIYFSLGAFCRNITRDTNSAVTSFSSQTKYIFFI